MQTKFVRFAYNHRALLKRMVFIHTPILLTLPDFKIYVRLDDWAVGARIAVKRTYEKHVTEAMRPLLRSGMVVVDIGANIGYYTLLAAARVGLHGRVIAFEPGTDNCALLQASLKANNFTNGVVHSLAVADTNGVVGFSMDDTNGVIVRDNPAAQPFQVQAVALDTFLAGEPRVDLVKMDIEGSEGLALAGMHRLIDRCRPIIFSEFSPAALLHQSGIGPTDYLKDLDELGYALHVIHRTGGLNQSPQSEAEIMRDFDRSRSDHLDIAAFPR